MKPNKTKYILVSGYGYSGSSALVDFFKEFDNIKVVNFEFRLFSDPDGLFDLADSIMNDYHPLNVDIAVKRFLKLAKVYSRKKKIWDRIGLNYSSILNEDVYQLAINYIKSITLFEYKSYWWFVLLESSFANYLYVRLITSICRVFSIDYVPDYYSHFINNDPIAFKNNTKKFITKLFASIDDDDNSIIVLDQPTRPPIYSRVLEFFDNAKLIIVDREETDISNDMFKRKKLIATGDYTEINSLHHRYWHKYMRLGKKVDENNINTLIISFEDLVLKYESTTLKVTNFVGLDKSNHTRKFEYFNPEISKNNISKNNNE